MGLVLSERIKQARELSGISQAELSRRLGVSRSAVNAWEIGKAEPSVKNLVALAKVCSMTVDEVMEYNDTGKIYIDDLSAEEKRIVVDLIRCFRANREVKDN